jgi:hypothetical protein
MIEVNIAHPSKGVSFCALHLDGPMDWHTMASIGDIGILG